MYMYICNNAKIFLNPIDLKKVRLNFQLNLH